MKENPTILEVELPMKLKVGDVWAELKYETKKNRFKPNLQDHIVGYWEPIRKVYMWPDVGGMNIPLLAVAEKKEDAIYQLKYQLLKYQYYKKNKNKKKDENT